MTRDEWLLRLRELFGARVVAWAHAVGDYDGRERTLEVFNADARNQLALLQRFRTIRSEVEASLGGPVIVLFHTTKETARLHASVVAPDFERRIEELIRKLLVEIPGAIVTQLNGGIEPGVLVRLHDREILVKVDAQVGYGISFMNEPSFRIFDSERASQSIRLLVSGGQEADRIVDKFLTDLETVPDRNSEGTTDIPTDPAQLHVRDQAAADKRPPRKAA